MRVDFRGRSNLSLGFEDRQRELHDDYNVWLEYDRKLRLGHELADVLVIPRRQREFVVVSLDSSGHTRSVLEDRGYATHQDEITAADSRAQLQTIAAEHSGQLALYSVQAPIALAESHQLPYGIDTYAILLKPDVEIDVAA